MPHDSFYYTVRLFSILYDTQYVHAIVYVHTSICKDIRTFLDMNTYTYMRLHVHMYMRKRAPTHKHMRARTYLRAYVRIHTHVRAYVRSINTYVRTRAHVHKHTHARTYIRKCVCAHALKRCCICINANQNVNFSLEGNE